MTTDHEDLLRETDFLDHRTPAVRRLVEKAVPDQDQGPVEKAVRLYYAVRDGILYDVYGTDLSRPGMRASAIIERGTGFCVHKSLVYAAALRAAGVPSRLYYGDVRNHLASPRLRELVGGDVFRFHALTSVYLNGQWMLATPVFDKTLCRLYRISPLDFDGTADSVYHPFDQDGRRHMEFLHRHGTFDDFPYELVIDGIRAAHPRLFASQYSTTDGSLDTEAAAVAGPAAS
jgi:transglutaminase-like putative cysteine protease